MIIAILIAMTVSDPAKDERYEILMGNIDDDDTLAEVLYKMNEHMMHIIEPLSEFVANEESMAHYVKEHDHLPFIMKTFESLPQAIEDESRFVETIDFQLESIKVYYGDTV